MNLSAQWVVGFIDGEGCFHVSITHHPTMPLGYQVLPEFTVVQHSQDIQVLHGLKKFFGCGVVRPHGPNTHAYRVRKGEHLMTVIAPFFLKHALKTRKGVSFRKFWWVIRKMHTENLHLTEDGLAQIRKVQEGMNKPI